MTITNGHLPTTKVLTKNGWTEISKITDDMEIAQVLADNTWEFVNPKIQQHQYNGVIYHIHDQKGKLDIKLPKIL